MLQRPAVTAGNAAENPDPCERVVELVYILQLDLSIM